MINQEIIKIIKFQIEKENSMEQIKLSLFSSGFSEEDIKDSLNEFYKPAAPITQNQEKKTNKLTVIFSVIILLLILGACAYTIMKFLPDII